MNQVISVVLTANTSSFKAAMASAAASTRTFGQSVEGTTKRSGSAMQGMSKVALGVGVGLLAGFGAAAGAAMKFDEQMSATGAAAGATGGQLNALREQALQMGADTAFSAREAAQAQEELAKAGLSTADILGGALPAALTLAASNSLDLGTASTYMADAMTMFNLEASQAGHVADVLAAGAGKSSTDVDGLSQSLNQAGLVANQFGIGIEETVGTLSLFASEGLKGSDAGTSLKTALQRLVNPSGQAAELMDQLGINVFDAQGDFIGLAGTAEELKTGLAGMTVEQRNAALAQIGGADAVRSLSILYESGASGVNRWTEGVNDTGYASEQAAARLDNLAGDLEALGGSIETALIEGGSKATGALRFMAQGATGAINAFSGLPGGIQTSIVAFAGLGGAALTVLGAIGSIAPKVQAGRAALESMGTAGMAASRGLGAFMSVAGKVTVIGALAVGFDQLMDSLDPVSKANLPKLERDLVRFAQSGRIGGEAASVLGEDMSELNDALSRVAEPGNLERVSDFLGHITPGSSTELDDYTQQIDDLDKALASLQARDPQLAAAAFDQIVASAGRAGISADQVRGQFDDYTSALAQTETANETAGGAAEETAAAVDAQGNAMSDAAADIQGYADALTAMTDPVFAMTSALQGQRDAQGEVAAKELELAAAREAGDPLAVMAAETALRDSRYGAVEAAFGLEQAEAGLAAALEQNPALIGEVNAKLDEFVSRGVLTADQANQMAQSLGIYNERAAEVPERITSTAELNDQASPEIDNMRARLLGWDGTTGTAAAFLADHASTPMGMITEAILRWDGTQGTADARADNSQALTAISTARGYLGGFDNMIATATASADNAPAFGAIDIARGGLANWDAATGISTVDADGSPAASAFARARAQLGGWDASSGTATAAADDSPAQSAIGRARGSLNAWGASSASGIANLDDNASESLISIQSRLSAFDGRTATATAIIQYRVSGRPPSGEFGLRWGGVVHARNGFMNARIATSPTVHWGERETGGEAYIPRRGNRDRSLGILAQAAEWYGMSIVPKDALAAQAGLLLGAAASDTGAVNQVARIETAMQLLGNRIVESDNVHFSGLVRYLDVADTNDFYWLGGFLNAAVPRWLDRIENGVETLIRQNDLGPRNVRWFEDLASIPDGRRFADGGTVPGRLGQPQLVLAHGGEQIYNRQQLRGMSTPTVVNYQLGGSQVLVTVKGDVVDAAKVDNRIASAVSMALDEDRRTMLRQLKVRR